MKKTKVKTQLPDDRAKLADAIRSLGNFDAVTAEPTTMRDNGESGTKFIATRTDADGRAAICVCDRAVIATLHDPKWSWGLEAYVHVLREMLDERAQKVAATRIAK